jgi:hypothetical protein
MTDREFENIMKRKQFVDDIKGWTRKFTFVCKKDDEFFIAHRIEGKIGRLTKIEIEHIDEWIKYFDRI